MCIGIAIISFGKISVERGNNGVFPFRVAGMSGPLANTWPTGIS